MKTLDLIALTFKIKSYERNHLQCYSDWFNVIPDIKPLKIKQLLRYKIQKTFFVKKRSEKVLYEYCKKLFYTVVLEHIELTIFLLAINGDKYNLYLYKNKKCFLSFTRRINLYGKIFISYDNLYCKLLMKKPARYYHDNATYIFKMNYKFDNPNEFFFFILYLENFFTKHKSFMKSISINYYIKTASSYHPRELEIAWIHLKKKKKFIKSFIKLFYNRWRGINLEEYYYDAEPGYFLIKYTIYENSAIIPILDKFVYLKSPYIHIDKQQQAESITEHDFKIIK